MILYQEGRKLTNVLLIYEAFIPSVRLCAYEQIKYLSDKGLLQFEHTTARKITGKQCSKADIVFFVRSSTMLELSLAKKMKKKKKYLIYIMDDDLLNIGQELISTQYFEMPNSKKRINSMLDLCDVLVSPSLRILQKYEIGNKRKQVLIEEPCKIIQNYNKAENNKIKIGFAGSPDHNNELNNMLHNVLSRIYRKWEDLVEIEFIGAKPEIVDELGLKYYSYTDDYDNYQKLLINLNWDIGLAPLADTEFNKCKHYNKYVEYAAVGCVGVYSNIETYTRIVKNNVNGFLCDNSEEAWFNTLEFIIKNKNILKTITDNIKQDILQNFTVSVISEKYLADIPELKSYKSPNCKKFGVNISKFISIIIRGCEYIKRNGIKTPIALIHRSTKNNIF
jgi:glycosyltransferase involved in cell wall biosynthesis